MVQKHMHVKKPPLKFSNILQYKSSLVQQILLKPPENNSMV